MIRLLLSSVVFLIIGCAHSKSVSPSAYIAKVNTLSEQLVSKQFSGSGQYTLRLVPSALRIIQLYKNKHINVVQAQEMLAQSSERYDFMLHVIIPENGSREFMSFDNGKDSYESKVKYFSFLFGDDIKFRGKDGVWMKVSGYNFERDFGLTPKGTMLFSLPRLVIGKTLVIEIKDQIFGNQALQFEFDLNVINKLPRLEPVSKWKF